MEKELISVVIPVYNVEKYLKRCVESVVNQTYKNLEIILVDDGSPDECPQICDKLSKEDERIKVIHKSNQGLGMARNTGIENATGKYICFFDSDDYVELTTIEKSYDSIKKNKADIVIYGLSCVNNNGEVISQMVPNMSKKVYEGDEVVNIFLPSLIAHNPVNGKKEGLNMSAWSCMYSMELIKKSNWRFVSEREYISEDFYSLLVLYKNVTSVSIVPEPFYYYCDNEQSLTHTFNENRYARVRECYEGMINVADEYEYPKVVRESLYSQYIGSTIGVMKLVVKSDMPKKTKVSNIKKIVEYKTLQQVIREMNVRIESFPRKIVIWLMKNRKTMLVKKIVEIKG